MAKSKEELEPGYSVSDVVKAINSDKYTCNVQNKQLVNDMLTAKNKQKFHSKPFIMANLKWRIDIYPNGINDKLEGYVNIFLTLLSLPSTLQQITLSRCLSCNRTMRSISGTAKYTKSAMSLGNLGKQLSLCQWRIMNVESLSISVNINIIEIVLSKNINYSMMPYFKATQSAILKQYKFDHYNMNTRYEWNIDASTIHLFKNSKNGEQFASGIYNNIWKLECTPNGYNDESLGYIGVYLLLFTVPPFISKIKINYSLLCKETNTKFGKYSADFDYDTKQRRGVIKFMRLSDIDSLQSMTFSVEIEVVKVIYIEENEQNANYIYDPMQIAQILSIDGNVKPNESVVGLQENEEMKQQIQDINNNNMEIIDARLSEQKQEIDARLNSLSSNIKENNMMMKEMQNNIQEITKQINDLRVIVDEENKNDDLYEIREEMKLVKETVNKLMSDNKVKYDGNSVSKWLTNIVKLPQYIDLFIENGLDDMDIIKHIKMNELTMIGMDKIGHKIKIIKEIEALNQNQNKQSVSHYEGSTAYI